MRQPPIGTAGEEVLTWLTNRRSRTWSKNSRDALHGNRALVESVCQRLVANGYLDADYQAGETTYTLNAKGRAKARDLGFWL